VIRSRALWVLAQLARAEDRSKVRRALYRAIDPSVRRRVRRCVEKQVAEVLLSSDFADDDGHVHRQAYLRLAGLDDGTLDKEGVRERFAEHSAGLSEPSKRGASLRIAAALLSIGGLLGLGAWWVLKPPMELREEVAESNDAWREGGRPREGSAEVREFFAETIPDWLIQLDRFRRARGEGAVQESGALQRLGQESEILLGKSRVLFGADFTSFLHAVTDQGRELIQSDEPPAADSHIRSVDAFNAAIADRGLAYYVDAEVLTSRRARAPNRLVLSTYEVRRVRFYEGPEGPVRVLRLRRLDTLNHGRQVLGFTREQVRDALVLESRIETYMVDFVLPSLGTEGRMELVDRETVRGDQGWIDALEEAAAEDARALARARVGDRAEALGEVLGRRRALIERWQERFAGDLMIRPPRGFDIDLDRYRAVRRRLTSAEWRELEAIAGELEDDDLRVVYGDLEAAFADSVERHEAQHRIDFAAGTLRDAAPLLDERLGPVRREDGSRDHRAWHRRAELSAYLSEVARSPELAKVNLALIGRHLTLAWAWGSPESTGAVLIFEGLARQLGLEHDPLVVARRVQRPALAALHLKLRERSGEELGEAAGALWAELFGKPLPPLTLRD
jgi:hypothetical protein